MKTEVTKAKLHSGVFLAGINLGDSLSSDAGAKQVSMAVEGSFLRVTRGNQFILVPFTNVKQIDCVEKAESE